jgi:hypothetical protein
MIFLEKKLQKNDFGNTSKRRRLVGIGSVLLRITGTEESINLTPIGFLGLYIRAVSRNIFVFVINAITERVLTLNIFGLEHIMTITMMLTIKCELLWERKTLIIN